MIPLRPQAVIELYWKEQIVIEENSEIYETVYLEAA